MAGSTAHWKGFSFLVQVLARHRLSGTAMMTVRRPGDCNYFTDPGCDISRPNKQFSDTQLQVRVLVHQHHSRLCCLSL
jgi:putative component of membrane protein insertase Oxa1/YidC/SpoIIIJ protein YidD